MINERTRQQLIAYKDNEVKKRWKCECRSRREVEEEKE